MKSNQILLELAKSPNLSSLVTKELKQSQIIDAIRQHFPKLAANTKGSLESLLREQQFFSRIHKLCELYFQIQSRAEVMEHQMTNKTRQNTEQKSIGINKKITRAALARRHQKTQEQIKKDQIFIRLTPKTQSCIQFMLCNRNFPRMEVKLSCNQHLQYLINYLTNKWLRGKVGYKIVLYPDNSFLKAVSITEKEKALKQPFNNYLMFTDIMTCCGVSQNGVLNMTYEIVEAKKQANKQLLVTPESNKHKARFDTNRDEISSTERGMAKQSFHYPDLSNGFAEKTVKIDDRLESLPGKVGNSPVKYGFKDELLPEYGIFNKNSSFYPNGEESMLGSLGFNFHFGGASKKEDPHYSANSMNYLNPFLVQFKRNSQEQLPKDELKKTFEQKPGFEVEEKLQSQQILKEENQDAKQSSQQRQKVQEKICKEQIATHDKKLGTLISILEIIEKEKDREQSLAIEQPQNNNSNRFKQVKTVSIVKKKANN